MKIFVATTVSLGLVLVLQDAEARRFEPTHSVIPATFASFAALPTTGPSARHTPAISPEDLTLVVRRTCAVCHNPQLLYGNLSLLEFDVARAAEETETAEKMIRKLRAGMMPPPGMPRPGGDTLRTLAETLEQILDDAAAAGADPGGRVFQRLNRAEYESSIRALLDLEIDAGDYLPLDTKSANFDNIADVQMLSPTLLDAYLNAADRISRLAVGDPDVAPYEATYEKTGYHSQWERVPGAPFGTRGGISVIHNFPADGKYVIRMAFDHTTTGGYYGSTARFEQLEISIYGARVALVEMDQWMHVQDPNGVNMESSPIFVRAGPQRVSAAFIRRTEGPVEDLVSPHEWSLADRQIGAGGYGITALPHLKELVISGPTEVTGVSETPSRGRIFTCRPKDDADAPACAREILTRLAREAYRRPVADADIAPLTAFFDEGRVDGFEAGIRTALQAILASPDFVFRFEPPPDGVAAPGDRYAISDVALASRLSFFLWGTPPDAELLAVAERGMLSRDAELEKQVRRMLADPRAEALGPRFAAQWLRLQDLDKVHPDAFWFPDFDQQLADAMRRETELFFVDLVRADRSVLRLFDADWTFVNERLARHYDIPGVVGAQFRRVGYPDATRRGLFGHGSVLVLTSHANRTSPVLRGKWVMEVLLGTPPPPPPPGVPDLEETEGAQDGRFLTTRERMELHRTDPVCRSCHQFMDPIGLALDNFDVTGKWRIRENGMPLDTRGELYDGTPVASPEDLRKALLARPIPLIRTFTGNLMAYALGRRMEYADGPAIRSVAREAERQGYRLSAFILGVVKSDAFRLKREGMVEESLEGRR
ncbi:MAG: DUF1592 domain-containing protein [Gemmatimonadetes bacterium]|nr:DUF1592 domain-containing protein [Gemmatimonadota bacterium]